MSDFNEYVNLLERDLSLDPNRKDISYLLKGLKKQKNGDSQESILLFKLALRESRKFRNLGAQSLCCGYIAISLDQMGEPYKSVNYYRRACKFARASKIIELVRLSYSSLGAAYDRIGKSSKAIASYEIAVEAAKLLGDQSNQALTYFGMAIVYSSKHQYGKSIEKAQLASDIYHKIGNVSGEIHCLNSIAMSMNMLKEHRLAIDYYEKSITVVSNRPTEIENLMDIYFGMAISNDGLLKYGKASIFYKKSLELAKQLDNVEHEARCYALLDTISFKLGHHHKSIYYSGQLLRIAEETKDSNTLLTYSINIADDFHKTGQNEKAIEYFWKAVALLQDIPHDERFIQCLTSIGICHYYKGDYRKAIDYNLQALDKAEKSSNEARQVICFTNLGEIYHTLGDYKKSIFYFEKLLNLRSALIDRASQARLLASLAFMYHSQNRLLESKDYQAKLVKLMRRMKKSKTLAQLKLKIGNLDFFSESFKAAIKRYMSALRLAKEFKDKDSEAIAYVCLGSSYAKIGNISLSKKFNHDGLKLAVRLKDVTLQSLINLNLGKISYLTDPKSSFTHLKKFILLNEKFGKELIVEEQKTLFFGSIAESYELIIQLCLNLGYPKKALEFVERAKSRAFLDLISKGNLNISTKIIPERLKILLQQEQMYISKLKDYQINGLNEPAGNTTKFNNIDKVFNKMTLIYQEIRKFDPGYVSLRKATPMSFNKMDKMISRHENTILIEYFIAQTKTMIFLLRKHELIVKTVPCLRGQIAYMVRKFRKLVANQDDVTEILSRLSHRLIEPVSDLIIKNETIRFVPHQVLHYLPLHALTINDTNVINKNPVIYSPSSSILQFLSKRVKKHSEKCLVYGVQKDNSDKEIVTEARKIAELYNTAAHINVSKSFVSRNISSELIHFACHGCFNYEDPLSSGILLKDGILTAREMLSRQIIPDSNMITLSACESGVNEITAGDEFIGLTRALLYGGTSSILVSLWDVETVSTMKLMIDFYKRVLLMNDITKSLQKSQIKLMNEKEYSHPFYWAPFIAIGNPSNIHQSGVQV